MLNTYALFVVKDEELQPEVSSTGGPMSDASQLEANDAQVQLLEQDKMLVQLKEMIREREQSLAKKDEELQVCSLCSFAPVTLALALLLTRV